MCRCSMLLTRSCNLLGAEYLLLVERAQDLVDARGGPEVEEGRGLEGPELPAVALLGLGLALAGAGRLHVAPHAVLVVDGRKLKVAVELREVLGVDGDDGQRGPLAADLLVHELEHDIVIP